MGLKTDFIQIQNECIGKPLTRATIEEIDFKYKTLFNRFGLGDLQYTLPKGVDSIIFTPTREIDQYAVHGILNT